MTRGPWPADPEERLSKLVHDLRTPLTIVQGFGELLDRHRGALPDDKRDEYLSRIAHAAREMKDILDAEREERLGRALRADRDQSGRGY